MSYTPNTLSELQALIGGRGRIWMYNTADQMDQVLATGYITDASKKRLQVGDTVFVFSATLNTQLTNVPSTNAVGTVSEFASAPVWQPCIVSSIVVGAATLQASSLPMPASSLANFRNLLDGGDFTVNPWQRGTTFSAIANTLTYGPDRFFAVGAASSSISMSRQAQTDVLGFSKSLRFGRGAGTDTALISLGQVMETNDSVRAQGQQVTFSFWAKAGAQFSAANSALNVAVLSGLGADQSAASMIAGTWTGQSSIALTPGQGAAAPAANIAQAITAAPVRYVFTGAVPAGCTQLGVQVSYAPTGTNNATDYVDFYGFQLEIGPEATTFEHRDVQVELEICQRYYWQVNEPVAGVIVGTGHVSAANTELFYMASPVQMRINPTVTVTVGSFQVRSATAGLVAATGLTGNATHTVNAVGLTSTGTGTAGQGATLEGNGGAGVIRISADY